MAFLFNMFGKSNWEEELGKFDRISFTNTLIDYIPQYCEAASNKAITQSQITPDHPLYNEIFPPIEKGKKENDYIQYITKEGDTMQGISIKLDISEQFLRNINGISDSIYPGMIIKLPKDIDLSKLEEVQKKEPHARKRISLLLNTDKPTNNMNLKYTVYYFAGPSGDIKGTLSINNNFLIFNPFLEDEENLKKFPLQKLLKFNLLLQLTDIQHAESLKVPFMDQGSEKEEPKFSSIVQFMLYKVGNQKIEKKYKERLKQMRMSHRPIASISFSFKQENQAIAQQHCHQVAQIINNIIDSFNQEIQNQNKAILTSIPFFDIISEKYLPSIKSFESLEGSNHHILTNSIIFGALTQDSNIIKPAHFQNLVKHFPLLYKLYNWQIVFSARRDGSSFNTFLNKAKDVQPAILLLKEYKGNILGAFLVESIDTGKTGRGEMFIFNFEGESTKPKVYQWTTKNDFFVYVEKEQGLIGIGMGVKYGIFINKNFEKGCSAATNTFGNKGPLSVKEDFDIDQIQLWGVNNDI